MTPGSVEGDARLTSKEQWDRGYQPRARRARVMVDDARSYFANELLHFARPYLPSAKPADPVRLLEFGCGNSQWLPYFARHYSYQVAGVDYSEAGCRLAAMNLEIAGAQGDVYCRDFAQLGTELEDAFDVGLSLGVVEHFEDTASIVGTFARCVKPGGILITTVPNLTGGMGRIVARMDRDVFAGHKPVSAEDLAAAHRACGLRPVCVTYLGLLSLGMLNWSTWPGQRWLERACLAGDLLLLHGRRLTRWRRQSASWSSFALVIAERPIRRVAR